MEYEAYCDGGARGNPGPAAIGVVIIKSGQTIYEISKRVGQATNNVAEYKAVLAAFEWFLLNPQVSSVQFFLDSLLVVKQLQGEYKIKNLELVKLAAQAVALARQLPAKISYQHIPREQNFRADLLVNRALDAK